MDLYDCIQKWFGRLPGGLAIMYSIYIWGRCLINPEMGPIGPKYTWGERFASTRKPLPVLTILFVVLGGIYAGIFAPTEAAGIGVSGVFVVMTVMGRFKWDAVKRALKDTGRTSAMIFAIIVGGHIIGAFFNVTDVTDGLINWIAELGVNKYVVLAIFVLMYLILGAILDVWGMLIVTLPFVFPVILALGFDPVWFGVFIVVLMSIPPIFRDRSLACDAPFEKPQTARKIYSLEFRVCGISFAVFSGKPREARISSAGLSHL